MPIEYISDKLHAAMIDLDPNVEAIFNKLSVRPASARTRDERLAILLASKNDASPTARSDQAAAYRVVQAQCVAIRTSDLSTFKSYISGLLLNAATARPELTELRSLAEELDADESWFEEGDVNTSLNVTYARWRVLEEDELAAFEDRVSDLCLKGPGVPSDTLVFLGDCYDIAGAVMADSYFSE